MNENSQATLLVVDDNPANIKILSDLLKVNYRVLVATNGAACLKQAVAQKPDVILLDIMMPEMNGYDVCKRLKEDRTTAAIPVVFLTAMSQVEDEQKGFELGAVDFITKPISPPVLLARVKTHLRLKEAADLIKDKTLLLEKQVRERTQELSRTNEAFARFVPHSFLQLLGKKNILSVNLADYIAGEMTIMFTDIRSYTTLAESMTPREVFEFTNNYHNRTAPIISDHNGFVQQFQGDGVMAIFPHGATGALNAAIDIQKKISEYNLERTRKNRSPLSVGVGLHFGPIIAGIIGDQHRWEASVISDTVNTASRMEGLTKHYGVKIAISETIFMSIEELSKYNFRFLDKIKVKGKTKPLSVYEVFDADREDVLAAKKEIKNYFDKGQWHYYTGEYELAITYFQQVLEKLPEDLPAKIYLDRSLAEKENRCDGLSTGQHDVRTMEQK